MTPSSVPDLLAQNLEARRDHPAIESAGQALSYGELDERVAAVADWLVAHGVQRGDRVAIHLPKSVEEIVALFAVARVGAVWVDVHYQWTLEQLGHVAKDGDIRVLITDRRKARALLGDTRAGDSLADRFEALLVSGKPLEDPRCSCMAELSSAAHPSQASAPRDSPAGSELAALLYTSGSTGRPKGVMLTHQNIVDGARIVSGYLRNTPQDRLLALLPFNFDAGLSQLTTAFYVGATVILQPAPMPTEVLRTAREARVTGIAAVPPAWVPIVRYLADSLLAGEPTALPHLRYVTNTGGKLPQDVLEALPRVFPGVDIYLMYGLTEAFRSTFLPPELFATKMGSIGRAIPGVEIFVVDPERGLCGPDEVGELVHRGALISRGYWGNPDASAERIRPNPHLEPLLGSEPVCHSGDLVRRDADGVLWFVGRRDGMIKSSGFRLSPSEVEEAAQASGLVEDVVAFGVDDEELGQRVHLAAAPRAGGTVDVQALQAHCRKTLAHYMVPAHIHAWTRPFPLTAAGKADRPAIIREARATLASKLSDAAPES